MSAERGFDVSVDTTVHVRVINPDVVDRVTGTGGDEWRAQFYPLWTAEDVAEHLASNFVNGVSDVTRLDGWADCSAEDVEFHVIGTDVMVAENG